MQLTCASCACLRDASLCFDRASPGPVRVRSRQSWGLGRAGWGEGFAPPPSMASLRQRREPRAVSVRLRRTYLLDGSSVDWSSLDFSFTTSSFSSTMALSRMPMSFSESFWRLSMAVSCGFASAKLGGAALRES